MNKEEIERRLLVAENKLQRIAELQDEIHTLREMLDAAPEDEIPESPVFEDETDRLYYVTSNLRATIGSRMGAGTDFNEFHTSEYATIFATKCREIAMLMHCKWYVDREYVPNWNDNSKKYIVCFANESKEYIVDYFTQYELGNVFFSNLETAQKAADWMNEYINKERCCCNEDG